jgi:hypothetical protein
MKSEYLGAGLLTVAKTQAASYALQSLLGSPPVISYSDTQGIISFTPEQSAKLRELMTAKMTDNTPTDIKINLLPALMPLLFQGGLPILGGLVLLGYLLGISGNKRRKR